MAYVVAGLLVLMALFAALAHRWVTFAVMVMLILLPVSLFVARWATWVDMKREVKFPPPALFPVLIIGKTADGRQERLVCYFQNLDAAKKRYATWSFLLPEGESRSGRAAAFDGNVWGPAYSMERVAGGRQRFEVHGSPDDDVMNRSWYVAAHQQIFPEAYEHYGRQDQGAACGAVGIVFLVWIPLAIAIPLYVRSKLRGRETPQNSQA